MHFFYTLLLQYHFLWGSLYEAEPGPDSSGSYMVTDGSTSMRQNEASIAAGGSAFPCVLEFEGSVSTKPGYDRSQVPNL